MPISRAFAYRPNDLPSDTTYNMQLGMAEFGELHQQLEWLADALDGRLQRRPEQCEEWIANNGDPRSPATDPIDWIEEIPFSETRNYVSGFWRIRRSIATGLRAATSRCGS